MTNSPIEAINVEPRLLCGPGPANISPEVLSALSKPLLGHLDPDMYEILTDLAAMTARVYQRDEGDGMTLPISATGTSGMEAGIAALVEPGSTVIIGVNGYFGRRLVEIANRYHANVVEVEAEWGQAVTNEALLEALAQKASHPPLGLVLGSGFEDTPKLVDTLARHYPLIGNGGDAIARAKHPASFFPLLDRNRAAMRVQVHTAADLYERHFGCRTKGMWLEKGELRAYGEISDVADEYAAAQAAGAVPAPPPPPETIATTSWGSDAD